MVLAIQKKEVVAVIKCLWRSSLNSVDKPRDLAHNAYSMRLYEVFHTVSRSLLQLNEVFDGHHCYIILCFVLIAVSKYLSPIRVT